GGVGADLVHHVAVGRDAVCPDHHDLDEPAFHRVGGHAVGDQRDRDAVLEKLPRGEAGALKEGPGLAGVDADLLSLLACGSDHAERGAVAYRGQRTGVAVREDAVPVPDHRGPDLADAPIHAYVFVGDG